TRLVEVVSHERTSPFHSTSVGAEPACDHRLSFRADRSGGRVCGEVAIELVVAFVTFIEGDDGRDARGAQQVVSGVIVVSRIAEEGSESEFGIEFVRTIERFHAIDAVMLFGLGKMNIDGHVVGRGGSGEFVKGVAVDKTFTVAIPAPAGEAVSVEARAIAAIDPLFAAVAEFVPDWARTGFEFGAVSCQVNLVGRREQPQIVRPQDDGFEQEVETQRRESRQRLILVVESCCDQWLNNACPKGSILMLLLIRVCWFADRLADDGVSPSREEACGEVRESADARCATFKA